MSESVPLVQPLTELRLRLRNDLAIRPQYEAGQIVGYIIEDPLNGKFYRLGVAEYELARCLDGNNNVQDALRRLSQSRHPHSFTEEDAVALVHWLAELNLACRVDSVCIEPVGVDFRQRKGNAEKPGSNPLGLRFPLCNPDQGLERVVRFASWLFAPATIAVWIITSSIAVSCIANDFQRFQSETMSVFSNALGWMPIIGWLCLKCWHELGHGLACKHFGGTVREAGVQCAGLFRCLMWM